MDTETFTGEYAPCKLKISAYQKNKQMTEIFAGNISERDL